MEKETELGGQSKWKRDRVLTLDFNIQGASEQDWIDFVRKCGKIMERYEIYKKKK